MRWGIRLFSHAPSNKTKVNGLKLYQGRFRLDIRRHFFTKRFVRLWNRLSMEIFKTCVDVKLGLVRDLSELD